VFLSEAFTRPKPMKYLAKIGYSQSYTYFTWRNQKQELTEYVTELAHGPAAEYFRPNFFVNTPDILPEILQRAGRHARPLLRHVQRLRAVRGPRRARHRGVPRLGEVSVQGLGLGPPRQHQAHHRAGQPHPPRAPRAPAPARCPLPARRQRPNAALCPLHAYFRRRAGGGGQPRPLPCAGRPNRDPRRRAGPGRRVRGGRPARRPPRPLARPPPPPPPRPGRNAGRHPALVEASPVGEAFDFGWYSLDLQPSRNRGASGAAVKPKDLPYRP